MHTKIYLLILSLIILSCKNKTEKVTDYSKEHLDITTSIYPENLSKIFDAHGSIDTWNKMKTLAFTMKKPKGDELTITDLKNRKSLIHMPKHHIGYNGKDVWLKNIDTTQYKGNPRFYYTQIK